MNAHAYPSRTNHLHSRRRIADAQPRVVDWYALSESNLPQPAFKRPAAPVDAGPRGWLGVIGRSIVRAARRIGRAVVKARMAQARRLIALESSRIERTDSPPARDPNRIGARYY